VAPPTIGCVSTVPEGSGEQDERGHLNFVQHNASDTSTIAPIAAHMYERRPQHDEYATTAPKRRNGKLLLTSSIIVWRSWCGVDDLMSYLGLRTST
jgi:hypothetical protein